MNEGQIRRAGHWNTDSLTNAYLTHLPLKFVRGIAGFGQKGGSYYLPRAKILPPDSLVHSLWPWVDAWLAWFAGGDLPAMGRKVDVSYEDQNDLAGQGFLRLLKELRTRFL